MKTVNWDKFAEYTTQKHTPKTARQLFNYAEKYQDSLLKKDFTAVRELNETNRPNVLKGLSSLAKFLGMHEEFKQLLKSSDLHWTGKNSDDVFIERFTKIKDPDEIWTWIKQVKETRPELKEFMDLITLTGLRLSEAVNSFNLQIELNKHHKLESYFNFSQLLLEHYKFKDLFLRHSKKAFISFIPEALVEDVVKCKPFKSGDAIAQRLQKEKISLRFADIRECHATYLIKYLKAEEIDFLHGRISSNVFMRNYFNPALIVDLKARTFQGLQDIQMKIG